MTKFLHDTLPALLFPVCFCAYLITGILAIQLHLSQDQEVLAELRYEQTLTGWAQRVLALSVSTTELQNNTIAFQRRLIQRLGSNPCVSRGLDIKGHEVSD